MSTRRDFFNILKPSKKEAAVYNPLPPFFNDFENEKCANCEDEKCVKSCPENIIVKNGNKFPILNFAQSGCTYCKDCATSCEDVFSKDYSQTIKATFTIEELKCLAWQKTMCMSCLDACSERAIKFSALFYPTINSSLCNSCGFCISRCPTNAIKIVSLQ